MTDTTKAHKETLENFAKNTLDECYSNLDPWCGMNRYSSELRAELQDVGSRYSNNGDFSFKYKPMTPEEYTKYSDEDLVNTQYTDPGGPPDFWDDLGNYEVFNGRHANPWYNYYIAIEDTGSATEYPPPSDAPWSEEIQSDWSEAVDNRCAEAEEVQEVLKSLMEKLYGAAKDYADTDISNAVEISKYGLDDEKKD